MSSHPPPDVWAVVPAAGAGQRAGGQRPKQYLEIAGRSILDHSLRRLVGDPRIQGVVVVLAGDEHDWDSGGLATGKHVEWVAGGEERADSVLAGLGALARIAGPDDWVLVHDAARPCLLAADLDRFLSTLMNDTVGGVLAVPVADTLKRGGDDGRILETVQRTGVWQAQTPQMFRLGLLERVLENALRAGVEVTDEASAMEWAGYRPRIVSGSRTNMKVTHPEDLLLAEALLLCQGKHA